MNFLTFYLMKFCIVLTAGQIVNFQMLHFNSRCPMPGLDSANDNNEV